MKDVSPEAFNKGVEPLYVGDLPEISADAIKFTLSGVELPFIGDEKLKTRHQLQLRADCYMPSGWTTFHLITSDKKASMTYYPFSAMPDPWHDEENVSSVLLTLAYPNDFDLFFLQMKVSRHSSAAPPITILTQKQTLTLFPRVETTFEQVKPEMQGTALSKKQLEDTVCILELDRYAIWPQTLYPGKLIRLMTPSPVTPDSEWRLVQRYRRSPSSRTVVPTSDSETTRFYTKSEEALHYHFGSFDDGDKIHRLAFVYM